MVFALSSLLWGILAGSLIAVTALIASTVDVNGSRNLLISQGQSSSAISSRISSSSSSRKLEFYALLIPTIGVVALNQLVVITPIADTVAEPTGDLVGLQWYWTYNQNDVAIVSNSSVGQLLGVVTSNAAIVATGNFLVALSAVDVIHAFAVPTLAVKTDAIPGRCAVVRVMTEIPGSYFGQCSELCGSMHPFMPIQIVAVFRGF